MSRFVLVALTLLVVCFFAIAARAELTEAEHEKIHCKVCDRAIAHIWNEGVALRKHCKMHNTDPRCDNTNLHRTGIHEMIKDVCDDLPKTHQGLLHDDEFEIFSHEEPTHETELLEAIQGSCKKWVHDHNGLPALNKFIFANLDSGKPTRAILHPLQRRFCRGACQRKKSTISQSIEEL